MPFMLLALVYVPLRKGLDEVAWQIAARKAVNTAIGRLSSRVVQSRILVERQQVDLTLALVGSTADAEAAKERLRTEISEATSATPRLDVFAVADAKAIAGLQASLRVPALPPMIVERDPALQLEPVRKLVHTAVERRWPSRAAGEPLSSSMTTSGELMIVKVVHLGSPLEPAAIEALELALAEDLGHAVRLHDAPVPSIEVAPAGSDEVAFLGRLVSWLENAKMTDSISACVSGPTQILEPLPPAVVTAAGPNPALDSPWAASVEELVRRYPRVTLQAAPERRIRFVAGPCPAKDATPSAAEAERSPAVSSPEVQRPSEGAINGGAGSGP